MEPHISDLTFQITKTECYHFYLGRYAEIWKAQYSHHPGLIDPTKHSDNPVSVDVVVKVPKGAPADVEVLNKKFWREVNIWSTATHPNITPLLGICFNFDRPHIPCLVSPYFSCGTITSYIKEHPTVDKLPLITQIAGALTYLHSRSIIHGDVKGSNVLINDKRESSLIDFGLSRVFQPSVETTTETDTRKDTEMLTPTAGSVRLKIPKLSSLCEDEGFSTMTTEAWRWKAPELIADSVPDGGGTTPYVIAAADVWAFAFTVLEVFTGCVPFSHIKNDASVILAVMAGDRPKRADCPQISDVIWGMLEPCWDVDPTRRPSMATLFNFFKLQSPPIP